MKRNNKALYESIMRNVSKEVKKVLNEEIMELKQNITQEKKTNSDITHKNHMLNNQIKDIKIQSESQKNKMQNIIQKIK